MPAYKWGIKQHKNRQLKQHTYREDTFTTFFIQSVLLFLSVLLHIISGSKWLRIVILYFGTNLIFLLVSILSMFLGGTRECSGARRAADAAAQQAIGQAQRALPAPPHAKSALQKDVPVQLGLKRRESPASSSRRLTIRTYDEYKKEFMLTKDLERDFKSWTLSHVIDPILSSEGAPARSAVYAGQSGAPTRPIFKNMSNDDMEIAHLISTNGFICYDKNNEAHSKTLFKFLYNYFNSQIPNYGSYYINPMDEFVFEDINRVRLSNFGLLIEDTESFLESKKMFNVYFLSKNIVYDTGGDVLLAFLLLLIHSNVNSGGYLGSLSLRNFRFLYKQ